MVIVVEGGAAIGFVVGVWDRGFPPSPRLRPALVAVVASPLNNMSVSNEAADWQKLLAEALLPRMLAKSMGLAGD